MVEGEDGTQQHRSLLQSEMGRRIEEKACVKGVSPVTSADKDAASGKPNPILGIPSQCGFDQRVASFDFVRWSYDS